MTSCARAREAHSSPATKERADLRVDSALSGTVAIDRCDRSTTGKIIVTTGGRAQKAADPIGLRAKYRRPNRAPRCALRRPAGRRSCVEESSGDWRWRGRVRARRRSPLHSWPDATGRWCHAVRSRHRLCNPNPIAFA
jgi:hypothetical protein